MSTATCLLQEWDLLENHVIPSLPAKGPGTTTAWSVGSVADAVAVAAVLKHSSALESDDTGGIRVFSTEIGGPVEDVSFSLAEVSCVPVQARSALFHRLRRRWVPRECLSNHIFLSEPSEPVDLLTVDAELPGEEVLYKAIDRVAAGGQLLLQDAGAVRISYGKLRPGSVDDRLFEKCCAPVPIDEIGGAVEDEQLRTLARAQLERDLIEGYTGLARSLAKRFAHNRDTLPDLEQVAMVALVKAARGYDPTRSNSFSTYSTASILGELKRYFRDKTWMLRVPRSVQELYLEVKRVREDLTQQLGAMPTAAEIAAHLDAKESDVLNAINAGENYAPASLDAGAEVGLVGKLPSLETGFDSLLDRDRLRALLPALELRERLVLKRVYFDGCTQQQIGEELGVSQMQVSRLIHRTLDKLRKSMAE